MTRSGEEEIVLLDDVIREAIEVLSDTASVAHVTVELMPTPRIFFARASDLFATGDCERAPKCDSADCLVSTAARGRVEICLAQTFREGKPMLQVSMEDDGPGIHQRLRTRIFEMDYTTRAEGSGLGLYLSRNLIESLGGRITLAESHLLWGSTFAIDLPFRT